MENAAVIEKIKKLLRMKRGGSVAEIETALELAHKLANKYNIDINSIDENESAKESITHCNAVYLKRIQSECKYAALLAERFFHVRVFIHGLGLTFVGTKTNIEIARYIHNFLINCFRREWKLKTKKLRNRKAFMYGMYAGLYYKLTLTEPKQSEKEGIILVGDKLQIENYMKEIFGKFNQQSVKPDHISITAQIAGYVAGQNIDIRPAINTKESNHLLI